MTFTLMLNTTENNKLTKITTTLQTLAGTIKNSTSIIDPTIIVSELLTATLASCNYAYIPEFNRYYFVKNITSIRNDVWEISCHVDV